MNHPPRELRELNEKSLLAVYSGLITALDETMADMRRFHQKLDAVLQELRQRGLLQVEPGGRRFEVRDVRTKPKRGRKRKNYSARRLVG